MPTQPYRLKNGDVVFGASTIASAYSSKDKTGRLTGWAYKQGKLGKPLRETVDAACDIGTAVHAACAMLLKNLPNYEDPIKKLQTDLQDRALNSILGFLAWKESNNLVIDFTELPLVSEVYRFGGTPDYIARVAGKRAIVDLKTGAEIYDEAWLQLSGYGELWDEHNPDDTMQSYYILLLSKTDGGFTHSYKPDLSVQFKKFLLLRDLLMVDRELGGK
jgi:hypothetical protein